MNYSCFHCKLSKAGVFVCVLVLGLSGSLVPQYPFLGVFGLVFFG
jgi:hypothetical protein